MGYQIGCPSSMGSLTSPHTFVRFGAWSNRFRVDPERYVTFTFLSVGLLEEYCNFKCLQRLSDMAMAAAI